MAVGTEVAADIQDVTDAATWSTSDDRIVSVEDGNVVPRAVGTAAITAHYRTGIQALSSTVSVIVDNEHVMPQLAYSLEGEVRAPSGTAIPGAAVRLEPVTTSSADIPMLTASDEGKFKFFPVAAGRYRLRATRPGYRPAEREADIPYATPFTVVLLPDPIDASPTDANRDSK